MSPTFVTIFTIALIIFAIYGFFSFVISVNRAMKKSVNKSKGKEKIHNKENTED